MTVAVRHIEAAITQIRQAAPETWAALANARIPVADGEVEALAPWAGQLLDGPNVRPVGITNALLDGLDQTIEEHLSRRMLVFRRLVCDTFGLAGDPRWTDLEATT